MIKPVLTYLQGAFRKLEPNSLLTSFLEQPSLLKKILILSQTFLTLNLN